MNELNGFNFSIESWSSTGIPVIAFGVIEGVPYSERLTPTNDETYVQV